MFGVAAAPINQLVQLDIERIPGKVIPFHHNTFLNRESPMLRPADREQLRLKYFIFHPIVRDRDEDYFDGVVLTDEQHSFFTKLLANCLSNATEFEFVDKAKADGIFATATQIRNGSEEEFVASSKELTSLFKRFHSGSTSDGILAVALGQVPSGFLLFILKTTFNSVLAYREETVDGKRRVRLTEIPNPISEDREAIQKAAIVNISANYDWEVLAQDRQSSVTYKIADFFKKFLDIREREVASVLTRRVFSSVTNWARANQDDLDPEQGVPDYKGRAIDFLNTHDEFDTDQFISSVIYDLDEERRRRLRESLRKQLEDEELAGRAFPPQPKSIRRSDARTIYETTSGVRISFVGAPTKHNITIRKTPNEQVITIKTTEISEK